MIITRPLTQAQMEVVANRDKPSEQAQLQAMKDFIDYAAVRIKDLEDKLNDSLPTLQS